jgi:hypothetical protein
VPTAFESSFTLSESGAVRIQNVMGFTAACFQVVLLTHLHSRPAFIRGLCSRRQPFGERAVHCACTDSRVGMGSGYAAIEGLLENTNVCDPLSSKEVFASWLEKQLKNWKKDKSFQERATIWKIEEENSALLSTVRAEVELAQKEWESHPDFPKMAELNQIIEKQEMKLSGLKSFVFSDSQGIHFGRKAAPPTAAKVQRAQEQITELEERIIPTLRAEAAQLGSCAAARARRDAAQARLTRLESDCGLTAARDRLAAADRHTGAAAGVAAPAAVPAVIRASCRRTPPAAEVGGGGGPASHRAGCGRGPSRPSLRARGART